MKDYNYSVSCDNGRCYKFHRYTTAFEFSKELSSRGINNRLITLNPVIEVGPRFTENFEKGACSYAK